MSVNYREHKLESRVAALEARVIWLEDVLARVVGQPAAAAEAANEAGSTPLPVIAAPAVLDRFLLRTQPMSALAWPLAGGSHGDPEILAPEIPPADAPAAMVPVIDADSPDSPRHNAPILDAFTLEGAQPAPSAIPRLPMHPFTTDDLAPAAVTGPAARSSVPAIPAQTVNLGITAAFETLEGKVAEAAIAELGSLRKPGSAAPVIAIRAEMIDAPPPPPRKLEVCCALELLNPSILQQITAVWASAECALRLQRLIGEDFGGRMGLDPQVREELQLLCALSLSCT